MKKYLVLLFLFSLFPLQVSAEEKIRVGVSLALTGNASSFGLDIKDALLFANKKLANEKYELIFQDDKCNGKDAVSAAHYFINIQKVKYVIGFACSSTLLATAALYEKNKVLALSTSGSAAEISNAGSYIFRTWPSDAFASMKLHSYIQKHHKNLGIISEQTDYAQGYARAIENAKGAGTLSVINENYLSDATDFRTILLHLRSKSIDSLFINSQTASQFFNIIKQVRDMKLQVPIYSAYWGSSREFVEKAGPLAEGVITVDLPEPKAVLTTAGLTIFDEFAREYGTPRSIALIFASSFEGFRALHQAIQNQEKDHDSDIRQYLSSTTFDGLFGSWSFDNNGDIRGANFILKVIKNGRNETIKE